MSILSGRQRIQLIDDACTLARKSPFSFGQRLDIHASGYLELSHLPPTIDMPCSGTVSFLFGDTPATSLVSPGGRLLLASEMWQALSSRRIPAENALPGDLLVIGRKIRGRKT